MASGSAAPPAIAMQRASPFTDLQQHHLLHCTWCVVCVCVCSFVCYFLLSLAPATTTPPPRGVEEPLRELSRGFRVPSQQPDTTTPPPRGVEEPLRELSQGSRDPSQQPDTTTPPPRGVEASHSSCSKRVTQDCTDLQQHKHIHTHDNIMM